MSPTGLTMLASPSSLSAFEHKGMGNGSMGMAGPVTIKCFFNGDNRVLDVPSNISLKDLNLRIQLKYGRNFILQYEDDEHDKITIDSPEILARAMAKADAQGNIRIQLLPVAAVVGGSGASSWVNTGGMGSDLSSSSGLFANLGGETKRAIINELSYESKLSKHDLERLYNQFQRTSVNG
jgi:hypothetical protein